MLPQLLALHITRFFMKDTEASSSDPLKASQLSALFLLDTVSKLANSSCMMLPRPPALHITLFFMKWTHRPQVLAPQSEMDYPPFFSSPLLNWPTQVA